MKYLKIFENESNYTSYKNSEDYITPNVSMIKATGGFRCKPYIPPQVLVGDVAYWDGSSVKTTPLSEWNTSLGTPVGVVVVPKGFAPDGRPRIISLKFASGDESYVTWGVFDEETSLTNFKKVPITDNSSSTSTGSSSYGYLPSDIYTGTTSTIDPKAKYRGSTPMIPSPYLGDVPNPEYSKEISGYNNALSDFNGLSNTDTLVALDSICEAANAAHKYNDGVSNLQWYLPAMGELGYLMPRFNEIDNVITDLGGEPLAIDGYWSSSEYNSRGAYCLNIYNGGYVSKVDKSDGYYVRPFSTIGEIKKPVKLITFTISDTEYQAEEGMTWEEWVNSQYNEIGAVVKAEGGNIYVGNYHIMENSTMLGVSTYDLIVEGENYLIGTHNGGDND